MNLLTGSMTPEQFQQYQQEQQQAFFRWQQSQILNRDLDNLQQNPPSFHSESSQTLTQPQQVDSPKKGGRKKTKARRGKNVEDEPQEPVAAGRWLPVGKNGEQPVEVARTARSEELMEQELRLKRKAVERAFEAQAEKDRTLMRLEELRFLATSTKDLNEDDAYWIKKQKRFMIKNKMKNDLGDEDDKDEDEYFFF
ncbi:hypothetical protein Tco_1047151 [Tanacetum coccineum]